MAEARGGRTGNRDARDLAPELAARALAAWREHDAAHALHNHDRAAVHEADAPRALVLELLARSGPGRDLFNACARLGRLIADAGASPSLAVSTLEGAARALSDLGIAFDAARLAPARASIAEGYFAVVVEGERASARAAWEYPGCAVRASEDTVAIVAGHPAEEGEPLADWAARVALAVSREGYRRAIVGGPQAAINELAQALDLLGIERVAAPPSSRGPRAGGDRTPGSPGATGSAGATGSTRTGWLASWFKR